jgi:nucleotide-binding universal stress UspA family protein
MDRSLAAACAGTHAMRTFRIPKEVHVNTILVGFDDTDGSRRALDRAIQFAKAFGAKLIVTSVAPLAPAGPRAGGGVDPTDPPVRHREELREATDHASQSGVETETVLAVGHPAESILDVAERHAVDMIIVGTREPGLLERLLGQSTSGAVARRAHCDVLIVH